MLDEKLSNATRHHWQLVKSELERHFSLLWELSELPGMEKRSAKALSDWLELEGFAVERSPFGIPTAFTAISGNNQGPRVAILAEYDALPGTSNGAVPRRERDLKRAGHACGHNQIGPANCAAAIAASRALNETGLNGDILVIGCPAEEILWGKIALLKMGAFENIDVLLTSHGDYQNGALSRPCQCVVSGEFVFLGESGHAGSVRRQNALDAAELAVQSIERLRAHHFPETAVEHILRVGGHIPNVTPDEARLWVTSRQLNFERAREVYQFVRSVAAQSAEVCGVTFKEQFIAGTRGYLPNDALAQVLQQQLDYLGPPRWSAEDISWMSNLCKAIKPNEQMRLDHSLALYSEGHDAYAQDDGEVSWRVPLGRVNWAIPEQVPLHNWAYTALSGHPSSYAGPLMASEALALAAVQVAVQPNIILDAKSELTQRTANIELGEPMLGAWRTLTETPEAFWDGTWIEM